MKKRPV